MNPKLNWPSKARWRMLLGLGLMSLFVSTLMVTPSKAEPAADSTRILPGTTPAVMAKAEFGPPAPNQNESTVREWAESDPLGFVRHALANYQRGVRDYACRFVKTELVCGKMTKAQEIDVLFREKPFCVFMTWVRNPDRAQRVLYIRGRWVDENGLDQAVCEPSGAIARFLLGSVLRPIQGPDARRASRRTIGQFGFGNSLQLILHYSELASARGELDLKFVSESEHEGQRTFVFHRRLPYTGETGPYPDRLLVFQLDQENLLPVSCISYADDRGEKLLGRYEMTNVRLNVGFVDERFDRRKLGL
jgi:hypothetical protein